MSIINFLNALFCVERAAQKDRKTLIASFGDESLFY